MGLVNSAEQNLKNRVSVLINTCDNYEDVWKPFFFFFKKYWDCPYKVYLNTESKTCYEPGVSTINCKGKNLSWSARLKFALKKIKTEYVIFFLEDFFLLDKVNQPTIDESIKIIENDKKISVINYDTSNDVGVKLVNVVGLKKRSEKSDYVLNCQVALWRRKDLISYLSKYESAWQFEIYGSQRAKLFGKSFLFYEDKNKLPFKYIVKRDIGYGVYGGKWLKSNIKLFAENGISVDFSKMGFANNEIPPSAVIPPKKCLKQRWMYLLYGGGEKARTEIGEQIKYAFRHPINNLRVLKRKLKYFLTNKI